MFYFRQNFKTLPSFEDRKHIRSIIQPGAVHVDGLSRDVFVLVNDEKEHGAGDFVRRSGAAHGNLRDGGGPSFIAVVSAHSRCFDPAGSDRVDVDAVLGHLRAPETW